MSNFKNQTEILNVDYELRLKRYDGLYDFALTWYIDEELVKMVDNKTEVYNIEKLNVMYTYLNNAGELYFIEYNDNGKWVPIGDVTLCCNGDLPIVISRPYQNKKVGQRVLRYLVERARELNFEKLEVSIYSFNICSQALFKSLGFIEKEKTKIDVRYELVL